MKNRIIVAQIIWLVLCLAVGYNRLHLVTKSEPIPILFFAVTFGGMLGIGQLAKRRSHI